MVWIGGDDEAQSGGGPIGDVGAWFLSECCCIATALIGRRKHGAG